MATKPMLQQIWLADDVIRDDTTGKVTVAGIFDRIEATPPEKVFTAPAYLFFALTGLHGPLDLHLCYVDMLDLRILMRLPIRVLGNDPLATIDVAVRLKKMPIPRSGQFAWELYLGNELLGCSRVRADAK